MCLSLKAEPRVRGQILRKCSEGRIFEAGTTNEKRRVLEASPTMREFSPSLQANGRTICICCLAIRLQAPFNPCTPPPQFPRVVFLPFKRSCVSVAPRKIKGEMLHWPKLVYLRGGCAEEGKAECTEGAFDSVPLIFLKPFFAPNAKGSMDNSLAFAVFWARKEWWHIFVKCFFIYKSELNQRSFGWFIQVSSMLQHKLESAI